jgi:3-dehydrosphinganine reductase
MEESKMIKDYYQNKIALVTGGSSGIGLSLAKRLAQLGAHVNILAHRKDQLETALVEIEAFRQNPGQKFGLIQADVSNETEITQKLADFIAASGQPDILINSAGVAQPGIFIEQTNEITRWQMEINYLGTVYVCRAVIPGMVARKSGHVINISSGAGFIGFYGYSAYSGSKYAVRGFTDVLRSELRYHNIRTSIVYPSDVDTPQLTYEKKYKPEVTRFLISDNSALTKPDKVAEIILNDAAKGKYTICTASEVSFVYFLKNFLVDLSFVVIDIMTDQAKKKADRKAQKKLNESASHVG